MTNYVINHTKWLTFQLLYTDNPMTSSVSRHNRTAQLQMHTCSYVQYMYSVKSGNQTPRSYFRYFPAAVFQSFRNIHKSECVNHSFWIPSLIHLIVVLASWTKHDSISYSDHTTVKRHVSSSTSLPKYQECRKNKSCLSSDTLISHQHLPYISPPYSILWFGLKMCTYLDNSWR